MNSVSTNAQKAILSGRETLPIGVALLLRLRLAVVVLYTYYLFPSLTELAVGLALKELRPALHSPIHFGQENALLRLAPATYGRTGSPATFRPNAGRD